MKMKQYLETNLWVYQKQSLKINELSIYLKKENKRTAKELQRTQNEENADYNKR